VYADIPGLARAARHDVIAEHGYVLTLGRYVGAEDVEEDGPPPPHGLPRQATLEERFAKSAQVTGLIRQRLVDITVIAE
jgi:type I restriction enzyme M protein